MTEDTIRFRISQGSTTELSEHRGNTTMSVRNDAAYTIYDDAGVAVQKAVVDMTASEVWHAFEYAARKRDAIRLRHPIFYKRLDEIQEKLAELAEADPQADLIVLLLKAGMGATDMIEIEDMTVSALIDEWREYWELTAKSVHGRFADLLPHYDPGRAAK